jgi:hypothetical protein
MDDDLLSILDKAGLDEERCKKSKKLRQIRTILINRYTNMMLREETCAELEFMSLRTYHRRLNAGLAKISRFVLKDNIARSQKELIKQVKVALKLLHR